MTTSRSLRHLPAARCGAWEVRRSYVPPNALGDLWTGLPIPAGTYTQLVRTNPDGTPQLVMADWPSEWDQHRPVVEAYAALGRPGSVLVVGLGLGLVLELLAAQPHAPTRIDVLERSTDVLELVGPAVLRRHHNVHLWHGDAFDVQPQADSAWDVAWLDVWDAPCAEAHREIVALRERWQPFARWVGAWCEGLAGELATRGELVLDCAAVPSVVRGG